MYWTDCIWQLNHQYSKGSISISRYQIKGEIYVLCVLVFRLNNVYEIGLDLYICRTWAVLNAQYIYLTYNDYWFDEFRPKAVSDNVHSINLLFFTIILSVGHWFFGYHFGLQINWFILYGTILMDVRCLLL